MTTFGDIRSLAQHTPSRTLWAQLCDALDAYDELAPSRDELIEYCRKLLSRWPGHIERQAPARWAVRFLERDHVPELCMATALDFHQDERGEMLDILSYSSPPLIDLLRDAPCDWFSSLTSLNCAGYYLESEQLTQLCGLPWVQSLETLGLCENHVDDRFLQFVSMFTSLKKLDISYAQSSELGNQGLDVLFRTDLEELNLSYCDLRYTHINWVEVFRSCKATSLRVLNLCGAGAYINGSERCFATPLAAQPALRSLEHLDLRYNFTTLPGLMALVDSPHLKSLRWLAATCGLIGDDGARVLASSPGLARLHHLNLAFCGIGSHGLIALSRSSYVRRLRSLEIGRVVRRDQHGEKTGKLDCYQPHSDPFDLDSMSALTRSKSFEQLHHLGLQESELRAAQIEILGHHSRLGSLRSLDLRGNGYGDEVAMALAQAPLLAQLTHLDLRGNGTSVAGREALLTSPYLGDGVDILF